VAKVLNSRGNHVTCFIQTLKVICEHRKLRVAGESSQKSVSYFSVLEFFYGAPCTSVFLPEGKSRDSTYLHTFTFILLATVYASYLSFQKVFLTLNEYLHLKMASP